MFIETLFPIAKICTQPQTHQYMSTCIGHMHNEILVIEKNEILPFVATWIVDYARIYYVLDLECIMLN